MGLVRTPGSGSASRLEMAFLPYRRDRIEMADATDDAHKPVTAISKNFMAVSIDSKS